MRDAVQLPVPDVTTPLCPRDVKWIAFDAVGTLIQPDPSVAEAYYRVGKSYGSRLSVREIGERFGRAFRSSEIDGFAGGPPRGSALLSSHSIEEARWRWIVGEVLPDVTELEGCFHELWQHFAEPDSWRCFDDVEDSLQRLADAGYRLAIASNFDARLHGVCAAFPQLSQIENRVVSAEVGCRKPAPQFYSALTLVCACDCDEILMIGDDIEHDVQGPRNAGLRALHLDRKFSGLSEGSVRSLSELVERLRGPM